MYPGLASRMSEQRIALATTITVQSDNVVITSTAAGTTFNTIIPPFAGSSGIIFFTNSSGNPINALTTGNIIVARTIPVSMPVPFIWSSVVSKWYVGAIS